MHKPTIFFSISMIASFLLSCMGEAVAQPQTTVLNTVAPVQPVISTSISDCPVTTPQVPAFVPPAPYDTLNSFNDHFWFGANSLWTLIPSNGAWGALPQGAEGYTQKILWWRDGYVWDQEPEPNLVVIGERLDESAPQLIASKATNAFASDIGSAMMVGVDFPTLGCWKITGKYNDAELSFVVNVVP